jgi:hypothetical protein
MALNRASAFLFWAVAASEALPGQAGRGVGLWFADVLTFQLFTSCSN